jgi:hypothetical protein
VNKRGFWAFDRLPGHSQDYKELPNIAGNMQKHLKMFPSYAIVLMTTPRRKMPVPGGLNDRLFFLCLPRRLALER